MLKLLIFGLTVAPLSVLLVTELFISRAAARFMTLVSLGLNVIGVWAVTAVAYFTGRYPVSETFVVAAAYTVAAALAAWWLQCPPWGDEAANDENENA